MNFFAWYKQHYWPYLSQPIHNLLRYYYYYFSLAEISHTLFLPWKREDANYLGIQKNSFLEKIIFNILSRLVGLIVRLSLLIGGWLIIGLTAIAGAIWIVFSMLFPVLALHAYQKQLKGWQLYATNSWAEQVNCLTHSDWWRFFLVRSHLDSTQLIDLLKQNPPDHLFNPSEIAIDKRHIAFSRYAIQSQAVLQFLKAEHLQVSDIEHIIEWYETIRVDYWKYSWNNPNYINSGPSLGTQWRFGYTPYLNQYGTDWSQTDWRAVTCVGRDTELKRLIQELSRPEQPFILLHGQPGVGRETLIHGLARSIDWNQASPFNQARIVDFDLDHFFSDQSSSQLAYTFENLIKEADRAGNVILLFRNFYKLVTQETIKDFNAAHIFNQVLRNHKLPIIGISTTDQYKDLLLNNAELKKLFSAFELKPPTSENLLHIGFAKALEFESHYNVHFTYQAITTSIKLADTYITEDVFPEKLIDILEKLALAAHSQQINLITPTFVEEIMGNYLGMNLGTAEGDEKQTLLHLEELLGQSVFEQEEALHAIATSVRRSRAQVSDTNKPIGSFLFLGPTGVGKTATAKALQQIYFKSESLVRFDMAEYQTDEALERLLGSDKELGQLAETILQQPHSVLLLDEFEKASNHVLNLFLTILDEGYFVSANGKRVDCTNVIIIATSNSASEAIRQRYEVLGQGPQLRQEMIQTLIGQNHFSPELLNRFDQLIFFAPLSEAGIRNVIDKEVEQLELRLRTNKDLKLVISEQTKNRIYTQGYNPTFGSRSIKHYITNSLEDELAQKILAYPDVKEIVL